MVFFGLFFRRRSKLGVDLIENCTKKSYKTRYGVYKIYKKLQ